MKVGKFVITRNKILAGTVILLLLVAAFVWGGGYAGAEDSSADKAGQQTAAGQELTKKEDALDEQGTPGEEGASGEEETSPDNGDGSTDGKGATADSGASSQGVTEGSPSYSESQGMTIDPETNKDQYNTSPVPEGKPVPVEPQDVTVSGTSHTCTLSVSCATILDNMSVLNPEKTELVPKDGVIFAKKTVTFYEGESVFNVLQREMKAAGIHMEFSNTPIYNSAYIEGINNLYEFDCGELSGWMYKVNGWFPNYGCSRYQVQSGDVIEWVYTCDLGRDVGGFYSTSGD